MTDVRVSRRRAVDDLGHRWGAAPLVSRRTVLAALAAGATAGGLGVYLFPQSGGKAAAAPVGNAAADPADVQLTAEQVEWELAPGKRVAALAYNGQVPGPLIRVREGRRLRVALTNRLTVPTTIHWHGVDVPIAMDGVPDMPTPAVQPGDSFVYEFDARPAGTRWYHTHVASTEQLDRGLYAPLLIEPAAPEQSPPDREYTLVFSAWVTGLSAPVPDASEAGLGRGMMGGMMGGGMMGGMMAPPRPVYDTFAVNGKAYPATEPLAVAEGERVRLRLINASGMRHHLIFLEGHRLRVTHTDGNALQAPAEVDAVPLAPSERYDVEFTADHPGVWSLHDLAPGQTEAGLRVPVVYAGQEGRPEPPLRTDADGLRLWTYPMGAGVDRLPRPTGSQRDYRLTLAGGMGADVWTINGQRFPAVDPFVIGAGDLVRLRVFNMSMESHPMHLHGHSFRVTRIGGRRLAAPLVKDTVDVGVMETAELEFVADNPPGDWMFHCHKTFHMDGGLVALMGYRSTGT